MADPKVVVVEALADQPLHVIDRAGLHAISLSVAGALRADAAAPLHRHPKLTRPSHVGPHFMTRGLADNDALRREGNDAWREQLATAVWDDLIVEASRRERAESGRRAAHEGVETSALPLR